MLAGIGGGVRLQVEAGQNHAEEQPAAVLAADEIGVLALPAYPRRLRERLFHHRRRIDEHLQLRRRRRYDEAREGLQRLFDRLVIVAALRIDRNAAEVRARTKRQRVTRRRIAHPQRDRRFRVRP